MIVIPFSRLRVAIYCQRWLRVWGSRPKRRFVEEEDRGMVEEPPGDLKAPPHPAREGLDDIVFPVGKLNEFQELIDSLVPYIRRDAVEPGREIHVLPCREFFVRLWSWKTIPIDLLTPSSSRSTSMPFTVAGPLARLEHGSEHGKGGCLAGAVRPEKAEDFALDDLKGYVIHGDEIVESRGLSFLRGLRWSWLRDPV